MSCLRSHFYRVEISPGRMPLPPSRLPRDQHTSPTSPLLCFSSAQSLHGLDVSRARMMWWSPSLVVSQIRAKTNFHLGQSLEIFPPLNPQVPNLCWVSRIIRDPQGGQCFCILVLFSQLDCRKLKHSSFPPLQAIFGLMAELKSAMKRIQANELRPLHKGGSARGRWWEEGVCVGTIL